MTNLFKRFAGAAIFLAVATTPAQAACWSPAELTAAKVRDLDMMLKISAQRCHSVAPTLIADYAAFHKISTPVITEMNKALRAHFVADEGLVTSFKIYDQFIASLTRPYGANSESVNCSGIAALLATGNVQGGTAAGLAQLANIAGASPILVGQRCTVRVSRPVAGQQIATN